MGIKEIAYLYTTDAWGLGAKKVIHDSVKKRNILIKKEFGFNLSDFKYFSGHSLGEYSALVCSGSLEFSDAVYLLNERGKSMQAAVPLGEGKMIAILGSNISEINSLINSLENLSEWNQ